MFNDFPQKRCIAINKNNKKCRAKTNNNSFFCCSSHEPINKELLEEECFLCTEKVLIPDDIIYFKCKHIFHKSCYNEWLRFSTYEERICLICRNIVFNNITVNIKKKIPRKIINTEKLQLINAALYL